MNYLLTMETPAGDVCFTKEICISVAQACGTNQSAVHRNVCTWRTKYWGSPELRATVCAVCYGGAEETRRPKPCEFARLMAEYVRKLREQSSDKA